MRNYHGWEIGELFMQKYPETYTPGLVLMLDADEGLGRILYDRAKYGNDAESWRSHNALLYKQRYQVAGTDTTWSNFADSSVVYHKMGGLRDLPQSLGNWAYTNASAEGTYAVTNIKYTGTGFFYDIKPSKVSDGFPHIYEPAQRMTLVGDALLISENQDFMTKCIPCRGGCILSPSQSHKWRLFEWRWRVLRLRMSVKGVRFMVDGTMAKDEANQDVESDAQGQATLYLTRGNHDIIPVLDYEDTNSDEDDHVFASSITNSAMPENGFNVFVTGQTLRDPATDKASPAFTFIDRTTRRIVGHVLGGTAEAAKAWDDNTKVNNLGRASFVVVSEEVDTLAGGVEVGYLDGRCPAAQIVTDIQGRYDVNLLPKVYRIAGNFDTIAQYNGDTAAFSNLPSGFQHFTIEGWQGDPNLVQPADWNDDPELQWVGAFHSYIKTNSTGYAADGGDEM